METAGEIRYPHRIITGVTGLNVVERQGWPDGARDIHSALAPLISQWVARCRDTEGDGTTEERGERGWKWFGEGQWHVREDDAERCNRWDVGCIVMSRHREANQDIVRPLGGENRVAVNKSPSLCVRTLIDCESIVHACQPQPGVRVGRRRRSSGRGREITGVPILKIDRVLLICRRSDDAILGVAAGRNSRAVILPGHQSSLTPTLPCQAPNIRYDIKIALHPREGIMATVRGTIDIAAAAGLLPDGRSQERIDPDL